MSNNSRKSFPKVNTDNQLGYRPILIQRNEMRLTYMSRGKEDSQRPTRIYYDEKEFHMHHGKRDKRLDSGATVCTYFADRRKNFSSDYIIRSFRNEFYKVYCTNPSDEKLKKDISWRLNAIGDFLPTCECFIFPSIIRRTGRRHLDMIIRVDNSTFRFENDFLFVVFQREGSMLPPNSQRPERETIVCQCSSSTKITDRNYKGYYSDFRRLVEENKCLESRKKVPSFEDIKRWRESGQLVALMVISVTFEHFGDYTLIVKYGKRGGLVKILKKEKLAVRCINRGEERRNNGSRNSQPSVQVPRMYPQTQHQQNQPQFFFKCGDLFVEYYSGEYLRNAGGKLERINPSPPNFWTVFSVARDRRFLVSGDLHFQINRYNDYYQLDVVPPPISVTESHERVPVPPPANNNISGDDKEMTNDDMELPDEVDDEDEEDDEDDFIYDASTINNSPEPTPRNTTIHDENPILGEEEIYNHIQLDDPESLFDSTEFQSNPDENNILGEEEIRALNILIEAPDDGLVLFRDEDDDDDDDSSDFSTLSSQSRSGNSSFSNESGNSSNRSSEGSISSDNFAFSDFESYYGLGNEYKEDGMFRKNLLIGTPTKTNKPELTDVFGANSLFYACARNDVELVEHYISKMGYDPNYKDYTMQSALDVAKKLGRDEVVKKIEDCVKIKEEETKRRLMKFEKVEEEEEEEEEEEKRASAYHERISRITCQYCDLTVRLSQGKLYHKCLAISRSADLNGKSLEKMRTNHSGKGFDKHRMDVKLWMEAGECSVCQTTFNGGEVHTMSKNSITIAKRKFRFACKYCQKRVDFHKGRISHKCKGRSRKCAYEGKNPEELKVYHSVKTRFPSEKIIVEKHRVDPKRVMWFLNKGTACGHEECEKCKNSGKYKVERVEAIINQTSIGVYEYVKK